MYEQIKILFPNQTAGLGQARLDGTVLTLETEENTVSLPTSELVRCSLSKNNLCHLATRDGQTYTIAFDDAAQAKQFHTELASKLSGKKGKGPLVAIIAGILAFVAVGALIVALNTKGKDPATDPAETETTVATESSDGTQSDAEGGNTTAEAEPFVPNTSDDPTNVLFRSSYSISEAAPGDEKMILPVVFNTDGDPILANSGLQMNYWMEFYQFMNSYGSYAMMFGLDYNSALDKQASMGEGQSWEQFFLEASMTNFSNYYAMYRAAEADGYVLNEEMQADIDKIQACVDGEDLENNDFYKEAIDAGFAGPDEYLQEQFGPGVNTQDYLNYLKIYYTAMGYYDSVIYNNADAAVTEEDVAKEIAENEENYGSLQQVNNVSVRHILIQPEGEPDAETNEYSQEQWDAALEKANEVLAKVQEDPSEDNFAALAQEFTQDPGSAENGGLYEDFAPGTMVAEFNDWSFDQDRKYGDVDMVKTSYGYHIMFFVEQTETRAWFDTVKSELVRSHTETALTELRAEYPITVNYENVYVFDLITASAEKAAETEIEEAAE